MCPSRRRKSRSSISFKFEFLIENDGELTDTSVNSTRSSPLLRSFFSSSSFRRIISQLFLLFARAHARSRMASLGIHTHTHIYIRGCFLRVYRKIDNLNRFLCYVYLFVWITGDIKNRAKICSLPLLIFLACRRRENVSYAARETATIHHYERDDGIAASRNRSP